MSEPRSIHPDLLTGLGRIVHGWAYVEALQGHFLSWLLEADQARMFVLTQNVSSSTVTDWIRTLLQIPLIEKMGMGDLSELLLTIDETRAERNRLVHGLWSPGPEPTTAKVQTVRWDRTEIVKVELIAIDDLNDLIHRVGDLIRELRDLGTRLGFPAMYGP
jgi:hypothetical protein